MYLICYLLVDCHCYCVFIATRPSQNQEISINIYAHTHVLIIYNCVTNHHSISNLKHHSFIISEIVWFFRCLSISALYLTRLENQDRSVISSETQGSIPSSYSFSCSCKTQWWLASSSLWAQEKPKLLLRYNIPI